MRSAKVAAATASRCTRLIAKQSTITQFKRFKGNSNDKTGYKFYWKDRPQTTNPYPSYTKPGAEPFHKWGPKGNPEPGDFMKFPNYKFIMINPGKEVDPDTVVFKVPMTYNKFMVKSYLEEIYGVKVKKVNTLIMRGKVKKDKDGRPRKLADFKKAYVMITEPFKFPEVGRSV